MGARLALPSLWPRRRVEGGGFWEFQEQTGVFRRGATMTRQAELQKINAVRVNDLRCPLLPRTSRAPTRAAPSSHSARFARRLLRASDIARAAMPLAVVGDYELTRKIGEGGYGRIFSGGRSNGWTNRVGKQVKLPSKKTEREMCLREVSSGGAPPVHFGVRGVFIHRDNVYTSCCAAPEATSRLCWRASTLGAAPRVHRPRLVRADPPRRRHLTLRLCTGT